VSVFDTCYRANIRIRNYGTMTSQAVAPCAKFADWILLMSYAQSGVLGRYNVEFLIVWQVLTGADLRGTMSRLLYKRLMTKRAKIL